MYIIQHNKTVLSPLKLGPRSPTVRILPRVTALMITAALKYKVNLMFKIKISVLLEPITYAAGQLGDPAEPTHLSLQPEH